MSGVALRVRREGLNDSLSERMDEMRSNVTRLLRALAGPALCLALAAAGAHAQQPTPSPQKPAETKAKSPAPKVEAASGAYAITSSIELGYRGLRVDGDLNKYQSDLNYKAGPRVFDTSFLMQAKEGRRVPLDSFLVTTTGWGADPYGQMRISAEKSRWFRFDGTYRRFKYFRFLNNFANPNFATRPTDPATGQHGIDTRRHIGDFDLTILPKNRRVRFSVGFSPESYSGPVFTTLTSHSCRASDASRTKLSSTTIMSTSASTPPSRTPF